VADPTKANPRERLLIKVIMPKQGTERRVPPGGTPPKAFRPVNHEYRQSLSAQVSAIRAAIVPQVRKAEAAPVRVKLLSKAAAKSHRPDSLFSAASCPIVGAGRLGELFVRATPNGLDRLAKVIERNDTDQITKELSCVESIEAVTPAYRRGGINATDILRRCPRGKRGFITRIGLFNYGASGNQAALVDDFLNACKAREIKAPTTRGYSPGSFTFEAECHTVEDVEALSRVVGVRSISPMPLIRTVRPRMFAAKPLPQLPAASEVAGDFPVVVVVDSGVSDQVAGLKSWIAGRDTQVAPPYRERPTHGTFVAGLICWGAELNPNLSPASRESPCAVFDLQVLPQRRTPAMGETLSVLTESGVPSRRSTRSAASSTRTRFKVWNHLPGDGRRVFARPISRRWRKSSTTCRRRYQVSFVISAGNYVTPPLLGLSACGGAARCKRAGSPRPADSVLGITVGAMSHVGLQGSRGRKSRVTRRRSRGTAPAQTTSSSRIWCTTAARARRTFPPRRRRASRSAGDRTRRRISARVSRRRSCRAHAGAGLPRGDAHAVSRCWRGRF
jgi:hypothetical protein